MPFLRRHAVVAVIVAIGFTSAGIRAVEPGKPSVSALEVTAYRALGAKHPDPAIRNGDYLAERFLGSEERDILTTARSEVILNALQLEADKAWASLGIRRTFAWAVHSRTRHIDAVLEESIKGGATQAVILGAGLDSRAYRFEALKRTRVFEVDFPPTQEYKKKRVREIVGALPPHVTYVPIDFSKDDLATVLGAAGYDRTKKTFFVWEGVTFYLTEEAVDSTLRFVATNSARGSRVIFDYFLKSALKAPPAPLRDVMNRLEAVREPLIFGLPDEDPQGFIRKRGLAILSDVPTNDLRKRYAPAAENQASEAAGGGAHAAICTAYVP